MTRDEAVERVARAVYETNKIPGEPEWARLINALKDVHRDEARAAIAECLAILGDPTEEMRKAWNCHARNSESYFSATYFNAALSASPLSQGGQDG